MAIRPEREGVSCGATVCCPFMVLCARLKSGVPSRGTLCKFMKTSKTTLCPWPAIRATLQSPRASRLAPSLRSCLTALGRLLGGGSAVREVLLAPLESQRGDEPLEPLVAAQA